MERSCEHARGDGVGRLLIRFVIKSHLCRAIAYIHRIYSIINNAPAVHLLQRWSSGINSRGCGN